MGHIWPEGHSLLTPKLSIKEGKEDKEGTSLGSSLSDLEQTIYQEETRIKKKKNTCPDYHAGCSFKDETGYNVYESTLKILKLLTNIIDGWLFALILGRLVESAFFTLLIILGFHELIECGGQLFYFLSNVVFLYVTLQLMDKLLKYLFSIEYG